MESVVNVVQTEVLFFHPKELPPGYASWNFVAAALINAPNSAIKCYKFKQP